jgi:hypothetical protein
MAEDYPSSNPFRRKTPTTTPSLPPEAPNTSNHIAYQQLQSLPDPSNTQDIDAPKKTAKKVRVQSPPPSSPSTPSIPDSSSTIGDDAYIKPPTPVPRDDDPFDSANSDTSEEIEGDVKPPQAPLNPFSKTLETMENPGREAAAAAPTSVATSGRASMDVDAFKRLLMTGNAGLGLSTPPTASPLPAHHGLGDGGSSTDASSISRQSIFEPIQETHSESPRTSHEISEPDDDRRGFTAELPSVSARKKPPPPSSRHGKLIKLEFRDDPAPSSVAISSPEPPTPGSIHSQQFFTSSPASLSNTDLNKPLPPAPNRASHESDSESVFDREAAGKTPEPCSPPASIRRKTPPAPPLTRRHSQLVSDSKITRETGRLSPRVEEDSSPSPSIASADLGRPRSNSAKAPPPPPSRRPVSVRSPTHPSILTSPSAVSLPPPTPPARGSSRSTSGRPTSVISMDMSSNKRSSMAPPPPPHRHGRSSMDDEPRRPSGESMRNFSGSSGASGFEDLDEVRSQNSTASGGQDILAEMSKLQREIDALRTQSEGPGTT